MANWKSQKVSDVINEIEEEKFVLATSTRPNTGRQYFKKKRTEIITIEWY